MQTFARWYDYTPRIPWPNPCEGMCWLMSRWHNLLVVNQKIWINITPFPLTTLIALTKWKDEGSNHEPPHKYNYNTQVAYTYLEETTPSKLNINVSVDMHLNEQVGPANQVLYPISANIVSHQHEIQINIDKFSRSPKWPRVCNSLQNVIRKLAF